MLAVNEKVALGSLSVISTAGALGFFLPSIERTWSDDSSPSLGKELDTGGKLYAGVVLAVGVSAAIGTRSAVPFVASVAVLVVVFHLYRTAYNYPKGA